MYSNSMLNELDTAVISWRLVSQEIKTHVLPEIHLLPFLAFIEGLTSEIHCEIRIRAFIPVRSLLTTLIHPFLANFSSHPLLRSILADIAGQSKVVSV